MKRQDDGLAFMLKYENVAWYEGSKVRILDRRIYPRKIEFVTCSSYNEVAKAISDMVTQSAGPYTAAGMGMALAAFECRDKTCEKQLDYLKEAAFVLANARPTTANRMMQVTNRCFEIAKKSVYEGNDACEAIFNHTIDSLNHRYFTIEKVANYLVDMFPNEGKVMTQCFGETIVGMMLRVAKNKKKNIKLFCPETRPYLQGARLTASVAYDQGFDVTVITDNMPAFVMKEKNIDVFTSAADSICLDGNIVNKVGTMQIAIAAKYFKIPYFVTGIPDIAHKSIDEVKIEERDPSQVLKFFDIQITKEGVKGYYPSFDITSPDLISGIVTDKGIFSAYDINRYFETDVENFY